MSRKRRFNPVSPFVRLFFGVTIVVAALLVGVTVAAAANGWH
jgi:hypothetical protein